jgi:pilus assembly protein Flp/PilA
MKTAVMRFVKDESGATAIEYGLIAAGIAVAIITALNALGPDLGGLFGHVSAEPKAAGT